MQSRAALVEQIVRTRNDQTVRLEALGSAPSLEQMRQMQVFAKQHAQLFGDLEMSVPQPGAQDRPIDYQLALLKRLQKFSPTFRDSDLRRLAASGGLARGVEAAIVSDAKTVAGDKTVGSFRKPGALREIRREDQTGQVTSVSFAGSPLSWMQAFMPATKTVVEAFVNPATGRKIVR
jgi:hypothetical protein